MQSLNIDTQAVLLLTTRMGQPQDAEVELLKPSEYRSLVGLLSELELRPGDLFSETNLRRVKDAKSASAEQIASLLERGLTLAMAYEKWTS